MYKLLLPITVLVLCLSVVSDGAPGDLDPTFGIGGIATAEVGKYSGDTAVAATLQPDGKIVIVGLSASDTPDLSNGPISYVSRINGDGSLDTSFGVDGPGITRIAGTVSTVSSVALQADGKIVVGGSAFEYQGTTLVRLFHLERFQSDGSVDTSFGINGVVTTSFTDLIGQSRIFSIRVQNDGKIVAVGGTTNSIAMLAARYNLNGSLDNSFSGDGREVIIFSQTAHRANAVMIQTDGKIVIGGSVRDGGPGSVTDFALVRLNADGTLDNSFDSDGKLTTKFGATTSTITGIDIQSDGKLVAAGTSSPGSSLGDIVVARYNVDGSLDSSFDGDGTVVTDIDLDAASGVRIQADGKIVICGQSIVAPSTLFGMLTVRYNTDGSLDNSFNGNGIVVTNVPAIHSVAKAVLIQPDSKVVTLGYTGFSIDISIARYEANGQPDASFGIGGVSLIELGNSSDMIFEMAAQPDGKIVAAGYRFDGMFFQNATLARFNVDGSLDPGFGSGGSVSTTVLDLKGFETNSFADQVVVQPDGKTLIRIGTYSGNKIITARYNSDGTPDSSYGAGGISTISFRPEGDGVSDMISLPDGKIVIVGQSGADNWMIRLSPDGTLDTTFGDNGKVLMSLNGRPNSIGAISLQSDGKMVVAGSSNDGSQSTCVTARYNADGTPDLSFGSNGAAYTAFDNASPHLGEMTIQGDGKILALGRFQNGSQSGNALIRLNPDGTPDNLFDGDGKLVIPEPGDNYFSLGDIAVQPNGKIVMPGFVYRQSSQQQDSVIFRLNSNGSFDNSFGINGIAVTHIRQDISALVSVLLQPDGRILAGGFSSNGLNYDFTLARFQSDRAAKFDFDGDGRSDIAVFRPSIGDWYRLDSSNGAFIAQHFGQDGDRPTPADFDGDGKTDIAVFRPSNGGWYILNSSNGTFSSTSFGLAEDLPVTEDYDGDGKADISVYRPSASDWYRLNSATGQFFAVHFGVAEDKPAIGDFDGDGKADISLYRPSLGNWYRLNSTDGQFVAVNFGIAEDLPTTADYDGDGKVDISVYRPSTGTWYRLNSSTSEFVAEQFGVAGDRPGAADFDGDGKADLAVFRPSNGNWYILNTTGGFTAQQFGVSGDRPASNAFVY